MAVADQPTVCERLWLLLQDDINLPLAARASLQLIRRRLSLAMARRESALLGVGGTAAVDARRSDGKAAA